MAIRLIVGTHRGTMRRNYLTVSIGQSSPLCIIVVKMFQWQNPFAATPLWISDPPFRPINYDVTMKFNYVRNTVNIYKINHNSLPRAKARKPFRIESSKTLIRLIFRLYKFSFIRSFMAILRRWIRKISGRITVIWHPVISTKRIWNR